MKKYIKKIKVVLSSLMLTLLLFVVSANVKADDNLEPLRVGTDIKYPNGDPVMVPKEYQEKTRELRGVWVTTVFNLDIGLHTSEAQYKALYRAKLDTAEEFNMNTIFFQVRGHLDAFYESELAPWSRYLTGSEGTDPGWDVVEWLIEETHSRGMEFHAWFNPYRLIGTGSVNLNNLDDKNFAKQNPDLLLKSGDATILNPGEPAVREHVRDVIKEFVHLYPNVDGIHFDDYFYYSGNPGATDQETFDKYKNDLGVTNITDFRLESNNLLVKGIHDDLEVLNATYNTNIKFGISPLGIYRNGSSAYPEGPTTNGGQHYTSNFIDSVKWIEEEWIDYILPQVYWIFNHPQAPYAEIVRWWVNVVKDTNVDLIIGHNFYDNGGWHADERAAQILYNSQYEEIKGSVFYRHGSMSTISGGSKIKEYWQTMIPTHYAEFEHETPTISIDGTLQDDIFKSDVEITLESGQPENIIKYKIDQGEWQLYVEPLTFNHHGRIDLYYKIENADGTASPIRRQKIEILKDNNNLPNVTFNGEVLDGKYVDQVEIVIDTTGDAKIEYYLMSGAGSVAKFIPYEGPIVVDLVRKHTLHTRTMLGNTPSEVTVINFEVIQANYEPPIFNITGEGTNPYFKTANVQILSSAPQIEYRINDGSWNTYIRTLTFDEPGEYKIDARNNDSKKEVVTTTIYIDDIPASDPTIIVEGEFDGRDYTSDVTVSFESSQENEEIMYRISHNNKWTQWRAFDEPFVLTANGLHFIEFYTRNPYGNQSEVDYKSIYIEKAFDLSVDRVIRNDQEVKKKDGSPIMLPTEYTERNEEIRAIWFSNVSNIDLPQMVAGDIAGYKAQITYRFDKIKSLNFNTIFFQVRTMNDAFYYSDYAPYSRYVTGHEGQDPGFDVLEFAIEEAHKRGLELHAWLNPYRVSNGTASMQEQLNQLHDDNFAKQNPDLVLADKNGALILNPGEPAVHQYLNNVITELVENYNIDGIHFDDYFYSYAGTDDSKDDAAYNAYKLPNESKGNWRRRNVDIVIENTSNITRGYNLENNTNIKFGISPFGIWRNSSNDPLGSYTNGLQSYDSQFADSKKWVEEGWLDYITPQLYWHFNNFGSTGNPIAPFADLVDWWYDLTQANGVGLVVGQAFYRHADGTWTYPNELIEQLRYLSSYENLWGMSFFTYNTLEKTNPAVLNTIEFLKEIYWPSTVDFVWESDVDPFVETPDQTTYTVTFDSNGGSNVTTQIIEQGQTATKPEDPIKEGFKFLGWYLGDQKFDFTETVTEDIALTAKWEVEEVEEEETSNALLIISLTVGAVAIIGTIKTLIIIKGKKK